MVLHVATGIDQTFAFKFFKQFRWVFTQDIDQHIESTAVSHGHNNLFTAILARATHQTIEQRYQALATLETKSLGARILGVEMFFQALSSSQTAQYINARLIAIGGLGAHRLKTLGQPLLFRKAGDMHKLWPQMATVGLFQRLDNLTQSCLRLAHIQRAGLESGI